MKNPETAKLMKVVEKKDMELAEAKKEIQRRKLLLSLKDAEIKAAQDKAERTQVMNELLNLRERQREPTNYWKVFQTKNCTRRLKSIHQQ